MDNKGKFKSKLYYLYRNKIKPERPSFQACYLFFRLNFFLYKDNTIAR